MSTRHQSRHPGPNSKVDIMADFPDPIPGIIQFGSTTLFAGSSGSGKSTFLTEWVKRWRDGRTICRHPTNPPTEFYYLTTDRPWAEDHEQRFARVGITDIPHFALADDDSIKLGDLRDAQKVGNTWTIVLNSSIRFPARTSSSTLSLPSSSSAIRTRRVTSRRHFTVSLVYPVSTKSTSHSWFISISRLRTTSTARSIAFRAHRPSRPFPARRSTLWSRTTRRSRMRSPRWVGSLVMHHPRSSNS